MNPSSCESTSFTSAEISAFERDKMLTSSYRSISSSLNSDQNEFSPDAALDSSFGLQPFLRKTQRVDEFLQLSDAAHHASAVDDQFADGVHHAVKAGQRDAHGFCDGRSDNLVHQLLPGRRGLRCGCLLRRLGLLGRPFPSCGSRFSLFGFEGGKLRNAPE